MNSGSLLLRENESLRIKAILSRIQKDLLTDLVLLIDRGGNQIAAEGAILDFDLTSLASLAAATLAAIDGLAHLVGESQFAALYHQGSCRSIYISSIGKHFSLVLVFKEALFSGKVRWKVRKSAAALDQAIDEMLQEIEAQKKAPAAASKAQSVPYFSDDDIDKLFRHLNPKQTHDRKA